MVDYTLDKLRTHGYRITQPRPVVIDVLTESHGHLTSAEILERVAAVDKSIGRASVFRVLDLLTSLAVIRPVYVEGRSPAYVMLTPEGHHSHIVCVTCGHVIELDTCVVDGLDEQLEEQYGVQLSGHLLEFYGTCAQCR
ncbi:MAG: transcriptional repressor [Chloroflexi bacterium]|nr:transcriptional repressor [Chloroflexota bacterium]